MGPAYAARRFSRLFFLFCSSFLRDELRLHRVELLGNFSPSRSVCLCVATQESLSIHSQSRHLAVSWQAHEAVRNLEPKAQLSQEGFTERGERCEDQRAGSAAAAGWAAPFHPRCPRLRGWNRNISNKFTHLPRR